MDWIDRYVHQGVFEEKRAGVGDRRGEESVCACRRLLVEGKVS